MNSEQRSGLVWIFLIIGIISLVPVGYVVYAGINNLIEARTIADKAWTIGGIIGFLAFPAAFIIPSLAIIIKDRRLRNLGRVYERSREPEPQPEKPKRDWSIFKVGIGISLVLITIGAVIILSNRERKAMGIEVEGTIINKRSEGKKHYFTVEYSIDGKSETYELQGYGPLFRKKMTLYVSKDTYASLFDDEDERHFILFYQNKNLHLILFFFGCSAFIIFIVSALTFSNNVETKTYNGMAEERIE